MAVLANSKNWLTAPRGMHKLPVTNAVTIYAGSLVFYSSVSGLVLTWTDLATTFFGGIATEKVVGTALNPEVAFDASGLVVKQITVVGVSAIDDVGDLVFALNDNLNDCTLTANTNQKAIGYVSRYYGSGTLCDVQLFSAQEHRALY